MDGMEAVVDDVEVSDIGVDSGVSDDSSQVDTDVSASEADSDPYAPKGSREYASWLKEQREKNAGDEKSNRFLRLSKDNHSRLYQLQQMEPRGIDGVREKYAMLDSVVHGELKGVEAIGALQDELRNVQEIDERLFSGDATALKDMGDEFVQQALPKLAGPILDMIRESSPDEYGKAILPHLVDALRSSPLVADYNGLVDVLNEKPPTWLNEDQKSQWTNDRLQRVIGHAARMGGWLNAQEKAAGEALKPAIQPVGRNGQAAAPSELETLRQEKETQHWATNITPKLDDHANKRFDELYRPYAKRLGLGKEQIADVKQAFVTSVSKKAMANPVYASQIKRYHGQSRPDANTVLNFARVEFDKHSKNTMDALMKTRFGSFLNGKPKPTPPTNGNGVRTTPSVGVQMVTVKPANIDHKNTPLEWLHQKKYRLTDGKVVQLQR